MLVPKISPAIALVLREFFKFEGYNPYDTSAWYYLVRMKRQAG